MTSHPCGSVPVSTLSLSAHYCHHHQAWWASAHSFTQTGEQDFSAHEHGGMQFGPFDTSADVLAWLTTAAGAHADIIEARLDAAHITG